MKVLVIGATGIVGRAVAGTLAGRGHEVVPATRSGPVRVDVADPASVAALFTGVSEVDAVVCCAASGGLTPLTSGSDAEFTKGLDAKLLGQALLVRRAVHHLRPDGSITLTSGRFDEPTPGAAFGALVNAGLEAFVRAAAPELPNGLRLNAVSPGWVTETLAAMGRTGGSPAAEVAKAYVTTVESPLRGAVLYPPAEVG